MSVVGQRRLPAFLTVAPARLAPVVLTCEHASFRLPPGVRGSGEERHTLRSHAGWDIGAWTVTRELARRLDTSAIGGRWSRLVIDLNRRGDDPTLIRREVDGVALSWNADLSVKEIERRLLEYHAPYHLEVDRLILRRLVRGVRPLLLAIHTFTPIYRGRRRDFDVGVLYDQHAGLAHRLGRALRGADLEVRYNQPYSGIAGMMYSIDRHATHHRLPCLELEVNQRLVGTRRGALALGRRLARAVEGLTIDGSS